MKLEDQASETAKFLILMAWYGAALGCWANALKTDYLRNDMMMFLADLLIPPFGMGRGLYLLVT